MVPELVEGIELAGLILKTMIETEQNTPDYFDVHNLSQKQLKALRNKLTDQTLSVTDLQEIDRIVFAIDNPKPLKK